MPLLRTTLARRELTVSVPNGSIDVPLGRGRGVLVEAVPRYGATWTTTLTLRYVTAAGAAVDFGVAKTLTSAAPRQALSETDLAPAVGLEVKLPGSVGSDAGIVEIVVSEEIEL